MEHRLFWIAPIVILAIGVLPMPYGYYSLSRLVVCGCAIFGAYKSNLTKDEVFAWVFGIAAVLYNPIIPIHLNEKELWVIVNLLTAGLFFYKKDIFKP